MVKFKKSLIMALIMFLVVTNFAILPEGSSAAQNPATFNDTQDHWAQPSIERWSEQQILNGFEGVFRPEDPITRAEFSMVLNNVMKYIDTGENNFIDLDLSDWYYDSMIKLHTAGVMQGIGSLAKPEQPISRQEAAVLVNRAFHLNEGTTDVAFTDAEEIAEWATNAVYILASQEVINGKPDGSFDPQGELTRAETATILANLIAELYDQPGEYTGDVDGNVVVNADDVVLTDMVITGDLFIAQGVGEGEVTLDQVEIEGTVFVEGGGLNTIIFNNVSVRGALVVKKYNGNVRILARGNTSVSVTTLESGAMLVTKELTGGGFETVEIPAGDLAGQKIILDGNFTKLINRAANADISASGRIDELVAEVDTNIEGEVDVRQVTSVSGVRATVNEEDVQPAEEGTAAPGGNGGSSGGGSGGDGNEDSDLPPRVAVTGITIDQENVSINVGGTAQLMATITPGSATNQNKTWQIADGQADVASVDEVGIVSAIEVGTETIRVTSTDGQFTDEITVQVVEEPVILDVTAYAGAIVAPDTTVDSTVLANSALLDIHTVAKSVYQTNHYDAVVVAREALSATLVDEALDGKYAYVVVSLKDEQGQALAQSNNMTVTVTGATYSLQGSDTVHTYQPQFGAQLAEGYDEGSFILLINSGDLEEIRSYQLTLSSDDYADTTLSLLYIPSEVAYIQEVGEITGTGEIGAALTAGDVEYVGTPAHDQVGYTWLSAAHEAGPYTVIESANAMSYTLTDSDDGKYFRVIVFADQSEVGGWAVSDPYGPVRQSAHADDVWTAIEAAYLGDNTSRSSVTSNLNLMTSLSGYPGVTISWTTSDATVIRSTGVVTRSEDADRHVSLTATLEGVVGETVKTYDMIVRAEGTDQVELGDFIDPYFTADYPQAYVQGGSIWVRFKLDRPAEVFMVVNAMNGHWESGVKSVLEGHAGTEDDEVIYVDEWPYFNITEAEVGQLFEFNTGVELRDDDARVEFVIHDEANDYLSDDVTSIVFDQELMEYVDTYPPRVSGAYLNEALDSIYIYYGEELDGSSEPTIGDFSLNHGEITNVTLSNYDGMRFSCVKLDVSGITDGVKDDVLLSYTGDAIRDTTLGGNVAVTFDERAVEFLETPVIERITLSSNRRTMTMRFTPGSNFTGIHDVLEDNSMYQVTVNGEPQSEFNITGWAYSMGYFEATLRFDTALPEGALQVVVNTAELYNFAKDPFPAQLTSSVVEVMSEPGTPTAEYVTYHTVGQLTLSFAEGFVFGYSGYAGGLVVQVDGTEYALRGFILYANENEAILRFDDVYSQHIKTAIEQGVNVQIKYEKVNGDDDQQLSDAAGILVPDFDYVPVMKR